MDQPQAAPANVAELRTRLAALFGRVQDAPAFLVHHDDKAIATGVSLYLQKAPDAVLQEILDETPTN